MKFGLFYEHQLPRPWTGDSEHKLFQESLQQVELADRLGIDYVWAAEHHFMEEYSHSSAPEIFLAACSQRTQKIRIGHGVMVMLPDYNHPARCAERISTLDLISNGRVEWGTGESASLIELGGFKVSVEKKHQMWREGTEQAIDMVTMSPYPGHQGEFFSMPCRNVVPKPLQKPHPPLWLACTKRESIHLAARLGMGALTFSFVEPDKAAQWVQEYYDIIRSAECVPIGHTVNANIATVTCFTCDENEEEAVRRGLEAMQFFNYGLMHYYLMGEHVPGHSNLWNDFEVARKTMQSRMTENTAAIGTPAQIESYLSKMSSFGVDQVVLIQQIGRNTHEEICQSLQLFADKVLPKFKARESEREAAKQKALQPYIEAALARKKSRSPVKLHEIQPVVALGGVGYFKKAQN